MFWRIQCGGLAMSVHVRSINGATRCSTRTLDPMIKSRVLYRRAARKNYL
jgi:hypothetical protein